ncbi:hypothetical protein TYRP_003675 [Tyrophagus putrescentiae]|nr:hypothetical protein TYRP_003675 [Tyrophagus putrescentiae]
MLLYNFNGQKTLTGQILTGSKAGGDAKVKLSKMAAVLRLDDGACAPKERKEEKEKSSTAEDEHEDV